MFIIGLIFVSIVGEILLYNGSDFILIISISGSQFILSQLYAHVELVIYVLSFLPPFQFVSTLGHVIYTVAHMSLLRLRPSQTLV